MPVNWIGCDVVAKILRCPVTAPGFNASAARAHRKATWIMIAGVVGGGQLALAICNCDEYTTDDPTEEFVTKSFILAYRSLKDREHDEPELTFIAKKLRNVWNAWQCDDSLDEIALGAVF